MSRYVYAGYSENYLTKGALTAQLAFVETMRPGTATECNVYQIVYGVSAGEYVVAFTDKVALSDKVAVAAAKGYTVRVGFLNDTCKYRNYEFSLSNGEHVVAHTISRICVLSRNK